MSEIELKFLVDKEAAKRLRSILRKNRSKKSRIRTRRLRSIYFDTDDQALHNAGFSVRLRRDGDDWLQTVKTRTAVRAGLSNVEEFEGPAPGKRFCMDAIPDEQARQRVRDIASCASLKPVCETVMNRTSGIISDGNGTRAELSVDIGRVVAGDRRAKFCEAEIELIEGEVAALYLMASDLLRGEDFSFSRLSKSDRGYLLAAEGRIDGDHLPRKAATVALEPGQSVWSARRDIFRECLDQIVMNIDAIHATDDPEGPHQLRVGLRRLRSALFIFHSVTAKSDGRRLEREVRWLGRKVGALRDRDVAVIDIVEPHERSHPDGKGITALKKSLEKDAAATRGKVRRLLGRRRVHRLLFEIARVSETPLAAGRKKAGKGLETCVDLPELMVEALNRSWEPTVKLGDEIDHLSVEARHELRKDLKKLRYVTEFSAPLFAGDRYQAFLKQLKQLQDVFGHLNDVAMITGIFADEQGPAGRGKGKKAIAGILQERQAMARQDWKKAQALWAGLEDAGTYWT